MILLLFSLLISGQDGYKAMLKTLYEGTVPVINTAEIKTLNNDPVILDTRSKKEYDVSHLDNARYINYDNFNLSEVSDIPKDKTIVVYCSVGYRSEKVGEKLLKAGYKNVHNLYGGIFQWVNEGRSVVNNHGVKTDSVHTYNKEWSVWLHKGVKVYE